MSEERTTKIATISAPKIFYSQQCLCCENTRRLPDGMTYCHTQWVCEECREAIAFLKDFIKNCGKASEMLNEMEKANENVHTL